ncbi:MAG: glycosyltransferase family 1 protein, partial [Candidatus Staskawiczbacteria bacterium]|nr:glycosyltransferase family 1 protein [Candidatus Staskawiczbacteria bacterium]
MEKKTRISFVYRDCLGLSAKNYFTQHRNFLLKAIARNKEIETNYVLCDKTFDINKLKGKTDVILLYDLVNLGNDCVPEDLIGIKNSTIPVIVKIGDPWAACDFNVKEQHEKYKIDAYFGTHASEFFYKYYPHNFKYKVILYGIEPSLYQDVSPIQNRIKEKILNSGAIASNKLTNRIFAKLTKGSANPMLHYKLRTMCNRLSYVDYTTTTAHEYIGDKYPLYLQKYASAIAATTDTYTMKYFEIPAAGCLTFMEVTENNHAKSLGYTNGETAIFINEKNYKEKFEEYLSDIDNPKWEQIANDGRNFAMANFNNDK